jgi:hypothetical protein
MDAVSPEFFSVVPVYILVVPLCRHHAFVTDQRLIPDKIYVGVDGVPERQNRRRQTAGEISATEPVPACISHLRCAVILEQKVVFHVLKYLVRLPRNARC